MDIRILEEGNTIIVVATGKLDAITAPEYENMLGRLIGEGKARIVVDFDGLDYISSAGLRALLATSKAIRAKGGKEAFANVKGNVREVFDMTGFSTILNLYDSVQDAIAALQ